MSDAKSKTTDPLPTCIFLFVASQEILASVVEEDVDKVRVGVDIVGLDPNEVRLELVIPDARDEPVKVLPAAVTVAVPPSEIEVPLIVKEVFVRAIVGVAPSPELFERVIPEPATREAT